MKKITLLIMLLILGSSLHAQTSLTMDNLKKFGTTIIKPTWNNLSELLLSDMSTYKATMKKYNYSLITNGSGYIANTAVGSPYYTIQKSNTDIMMIFTEDDGFASSFRAEIKRIIGGGTVKYESGYEIYYATFESSGYKYNIKIAIKENMNGSSTVGIIKI